MASRWKNFVAMRTWETCCRHRDGTADDERLGRMRILNRNDVRAALPMADAIEAMRWAYAAWSAGRATMPPRLPLELPGGEAVSLVMPAYVPASPDGKFPPALTVKAVSVFPQNARHGLPLVQGAVLALDPETGRGLALMDGA